MYVIKPLYIGGLNDNASDDAVSCFNFLINDDDKVLGGGFISIVSIDAIWIFNLKRWCI